MVEARENIDLVTIRRQSDLEASQRTFERIRQETAEAAAEPVEDSGSDVESVATETVPPPPADPAVTLNRLRLGIVSVLALVLLLVLVIQRRHGRGR